MTVPLFALVLAVKGELTWRRGDFVEDRVWLINRDGSNNRRLYARDVHKNEWITLSTSDDPDTMSTDGNNVFEGGFLGLDKAVQFPLFSFDVAGCPGQRRDLQNVCDLTGSSTLVG